MRLKSAVVVREDEVAEGQPGAPSTSGQATRPLVLGTFPLNSPPRAASTQLQFPQSPQKPAPHAFIPPEPTIVVNAPPLTPPSSPPENDSPPPAPRFSHKELASTRSPPPSPPKALANWPDSTSAEVDDEEKTSDTELSDADDDDEVLEIVYEDPGSTEDDEMDSDESSDDEGEAEGEAEGSEMERAGEAGVDDGEEEDEDAEGDTEWEEHRPESPDIKPISDSFDDIQVSDDEDDSPIPTSAPEWILTLSPTATSHSVHDSNRQGITRTPSPFPKSLGSLGDFNPSSLPLSPPPSASAAQFHSSFPVSSSRDDAPRQLETRSATPSFIDPSLAALSLDSAGSTGESIWKSLQPAFLPTPAPLTPFGGPSLTRSTSDSNLISPPPSSSVPRTYSNNSSDKLQPSLAFHSPPNNSAAVEEEEVQQARESDEEVPEPATARLQAGARFLSRMLSSGLEVGEQEKLGDGGDVV